jgi:hypothetical protein
MSRPVGSRNRTPEEKVAAATAAPGKPGTPALPAKGAGCPEDLAELAELKDLLELTKRRLHKRSTSDGAYLRLLDAYQSLKSQIASPYEDDEDEDDDAAEIGLATADGDALDALADRQDELSDRSKELLVQMKAATAAGDDLEWHRLDQEYEGVLEAYKSADEEYNRIKGDRHYAPQDDTLETLLDQRLELIALLEASFINGTAGDKEHLLAQIAVVDKACSHLKPAAVPQPPAVLPPAPPQTITADAYRQIAMDAPVVDPMDEARAEADRRAASRAVSTKYLRECGVIPTSAEGAGHQPAAPILLSIPQNKDPHPPLPVKEPEFHTDPHAKLTMSLSAEDQATLARLERERLARGKL